MATYTLRDIDPKIWQQFTQRASRDGWQIRPLLSALMDSYGRDVITPDTTPVPALPEWAWLRAYYREMRQTFPSAAMLPIDKQWEKITRMVLDSPAGMSYRDLDQVPPAERSAVLNWLQHTSALQEHGLSLRATGHISDGNTRRPYQYHVLGLPPGQEGLITDFDGGWRVMWIVGRDNTPWSRPHTTKEDALDTLARIVEGKESA